MGTFNATRNYYADLGVSPTADEDEIKKHFRQLAREYHPDRNPGHEVEVVSKFQELQEAYEVLCDSAKRSKYDAARAKSQRAASAASAAAAANPPPAQTRDDGYTFRRPGRAQTTAFDARPPHSGQSQSQSRAAPKPTSQQAYASPRPAAPPSAGAEKLGAFARGAQRWDRAAFEEAARNEGKRGFQRMPGGVPPPPMPPRPRQHPTAPRPPSTPAPPDVLHGGNPGFPGLSRTTSARRVYYPDEKQAPRSAYSTVKGDRSHQPYYETARPESPPGSHARTSDYPLRHSRSTEHPPRGDRHGFYEREANRYASNLGERTDIRAPPLTRSATVHHSHSHSHSHSHAHHSHEEESGSFGRAPRSYYHIPKPQSPPARHRSASPNMRRASFSSSSGASSDEEAYPQNVDARPKQVPKSRQPQKPNGLDSFFPPSGYNHRAEEAAENGMYKYPPPPTRDAPARQPFANPPCTEAKNEESTRAASAERPGTEAVFMPAKFQHEDWAEKLRQERNLSPSKQQQPQQRGPRPKEVRRTAGPTPSAVDAMDVDPAPKDYTRPRTNGEINLDDLKEAAPLASEGGLNGLSNDLKSSLPFESRAAPIPNLEKSSSAPTRLKLADLPRPPKLVHPPLGAYSGSQTWQEYTANMNAYLREWAAYEERMIDHFHARNRLVRTAMADDWATSLFDGPPGNEISDNGLGQLSSTKKAGFRTYMDWLEDDKVCHAAWETARDRHRQCLQELGQVRERLKAAARSDDP